MKKNISLLTTSRADYDQLYWLIKLLNKNKKYNLNLVVSGTHLYKNYGSTIKQIRKDKFKFKKIRLNIKKDDSKAILETISQSISSFSKNFKKMDHDFIILLGDRYETFAASVAASFLKIPIIHLNGGELTKGAHDDWMRHCITKMANIHFVSNDTYKRRVIQLGENPKFVYNTGGLSSDNALKTDIKTKKDIEKILNIKFYTKNILITYHPETFSEKGNKNSFLEITKVVKYFKDIQFFFTLPNADEENKTITTMIKKVCINNSNSIFFSSLGRTKYLSLMKNCDLVLGNSSSGLLEAPYVNTLTVNLGNRQEGRLKANSVIDCEINAEKIIKLIKKIYQKSIHRKIKYNLKDYYGTGKSAENMLKILNNLKPGLSKKKNFYDLWKNI